MTATRIVGLAAALLAAAGWALAAYFLWTDSIVPDGLALPAVEDTSIVAPSLLARAQEFSSLEHWLWLGSTIALLATFALYAWKGAAFTRESAAGPIGTGMLLGMLGFAILWLVQLPFQVVELWWQRRYDVNDMGYAELVLGNWFVLGAQFLFLCLALLIVMGLARLLGRWWWLPGGAAFVGLAALFLFVYSYLTPTEPAPADVRARAAAIARAEGVASVPIRIEEVSDFTDQVNAYAVGLGPSRRVVLWDTALDLPDDELDTIVAHEYGHHARGHLPEGLAWYALFALPGAFLIERLTRRRGGMRDPRAVPLSLLVLVVLQLAATPVDNVISRHMEREADWAALQTTRDPQAMRGLFAQFAEDGLADPSPPTWAYVWLDTHPTIEQRVAMARAWAATRRAGR